MAMPDFFLVGAMKCGTSTLAAQLAAQPGIFMCTPKEPNFFGDDTTYAKGQGWYQGLFVPAAEGDLKGEASTHYTKLPTYPEAPARLAAACPDARLVYAIRDPMDRLVSHYMHEWSMGEIATDLATAIRTHPELVAYSRYAMQIEPYVTRFGVGRICLTSLERLGAAPTSELARIAGFLGYAGTPVWQEALARQNVSAERVRRFPLYDLLIENPVAGALRRTLVPKALRTAVRRRLQMRERPSVPAALEAELQEVFRVDLAQLEAVFPSARALLAPAPERAV